MTFNLRELTQAYRQEVDEYQRISCHYQVDKETEKLKLAYLKEINRLEREYTLQKQLAIKCGVVFDSTSDRVLDVLAQLYDTYHKLNTVLEQNKQYVENTPINHRRIAEYME